METACTDIEQCDEARPTCKNCTRRQETCSYTGEEPRRSSLSVHESEVNPSDASPTSRIYPPANAYNGLDLALMHRYSTVTSIHLFPTEGSYDMAMQETLTRPISRPSLLIIGQEDVKSGKVSNPFEI